MKQLNDVDSQQHHFRFVSKPAPAGAAASAQLPTLSQQPYPPAFSPYGAPPPALASYGGYRRFRPRTPRIPLPAMPPLSKQLDAIQGMQGRYQFAPERDALYSGQGFRQAAQDSYDGVYQPPAAVQAAGDDNGHAAAAAQDGGAEDEAAAPAEARLGDGGRQRWQTPAGLSALAGKKNGGGGAVGAAVRDGWLRARAAGHGPGGARPPSR